VDNTELLLYLALLNQTEKVGEESNPTGGHIAQPHADAGRASSPSPKREERKKSNPVWEKLIILFISVLWVTGWVFLMTATPNPTITSPLEAVAYLMFGVPVIYVLSFGFWKASVFISNYR
jgi:hypothetical protein